MKITNKKIAWEGKFIRIWEKDFVVKNGTKGTWEVVQRKTHGKVAIIFALTPEKEVILERLYRIPVESFVIELPAGLMDKKDEKPEDTAKRELLEETGYMADKVIPILDGPFNSGTTSDEAILFFAPDVKFVGKKGGEPTEEIEVLKVPLEKLVDFVITPQKNAKIDLKILAILPILRKMGYI